LYCTLTRYIRDGPDNIRRNLPCVQYGVFLFYLPEPEPSWYHNFGRKS
jgi:hypothetical protein